ncbi:MAG: NAD(P)-dependent oxidoreductase [Spirochaetales bacterium]|nr:NAD(P)-dependent oxidoreductase [Spirochaetales bacterium]
MKKKTILMTGATGNMGFEGLKLMTKTHQFYIKVLVLPDKKSRKQMKPFENHDDFQIIFGDLTNQEDVRKAVNGVDYVLHCGALVSPMADYYPELTDKVNFGGTLNIINAIKAQPDPDNIKLVYIGSVAQMGDRMPPLHWERVGDPVKISSFDAYAASKIKAERAVIESGLKYWVSLRQTGILHYNLFNKLDPIIYHQPLNTHIEWATVEDSARILRNICLNNLPDEFWCHVYNIGGGEEFRLTYDQFMKEAYKVMGIADYTKLMDPNWFATKNFHCCWFKDSDILNKWLDFRKTTFRDFMSGIKKKLPFYYKAAKYIPKYFIKNLVMKIIAFKKMGPLRWLKENNLPRIRAFWGSINEWKRIPVSWEKLSFTPDPPARDIKHGYDESKDENLLDLADCEKAAEFRGGKCISSSMNRGDLKTPLVWKCALKHTFKASPFLVLKAGHWCPECDLNTSQYPSIARVNPFFAQVYCGTN